MIVPLPQMSIRQRKKQLQVSTNNQQSIQNIYHDQKQQRYQGQKYFHPQQQDILLLANKTTRIKFNVTEDQKIKTQRQIKDTKIRARYQIQEYRKVSQHLNALQKMKKVNSEKLKKLQKNVLNLDFLRKLSLKQSMKIKNRKSKMQQTQAMVYFLQELKQSKQKLNLQKLKERRQLCTSLKENTQRTKEICLSVFNMTKQQKIKQFKQKNLLLRQKYQSNLQNQYQQNRRRAQSIRLSQHKLKQKLKKYEQYKIYLGKLNYQEKLKNEYLKHRKNKRYLDQIKQKVKQQDKLFRKTQKLNKQSRKIEEFYLTGAEIQQ